MLRRPPESTRPATPFPYQTLFRSNGECVRLKQGDRAQVTVFNADPAAQARAWAAAGFRYLHLVDLDGAFAGRPANAAAVKAIRAAIDLPIQLGGGIRDEATIEAWLDAGITRVILGTVAVRNPDLVKAAAKRRSEEHTSELKSLMRISYAVFCLNKK